MIVFEPVNVAPVADHNDLAEQSIQFSMACRSAEDRSRSQRCGGDQVGAEVLVAQHLIREQLDLGAEPLGRGTLELERRERIVALAAGPDWRTSDR